MEKKLKVALVHDWLTSYGGAETWCELALDIYPDADIYTLVYDKKKLKGHFEKNRIFTSSLQKLPFATKIYRKLLKFMPKAFESFDFTGYDLVICSSSSCAKGVITPPSTAQVAYVHTPMRYAWDLFFDYRKRSGSLTRFFMDRWMPQIRLWDYASAQRIDTIIANSKYIARRIKKFWNRDAQVIYSPVNERRFYPSTKAVEKKDYYVFFSRLVQYKRADIAIQACASLGKKLVVIGSGPEEKALKKLAAGNKDIVFAGRASDEAVRNHLYEAKALIFCAEEDFGLTPLESQACGTPVIAFGKGGATETVLENKTGVFFAEQSAASCAEAIQAFEKLEAAGKFDSKKIAAHA
ncbi:MAG: glycosyltransferase, partial [Treponema sp.]|nr:glycosyltransferase [Treponema sp.]